MSTGFTAMRIQDCFPPVERDVVDAFAKRHGIYMPDALCEHLVQYNGGGFWCDGSVNPGQRNTAGVGQLLGIDDQWPHSTIVQTWQRLLDENPDLTPFAYDAGGHPFVLWRRRPGTVFYFDNDKQMPTAEIAPSLREFFSNIAPQRYLEIPKWPEHRRVLANGDFELIREFVSRVGIAAMFEGETLLFLASAMGQAYSTAALLKLKADPNLPIANGDFPLHAAVITRSHDCCRFLCKHGANVNALDAEGRTPLLLAVMYDSYGNTEVLLKHKADVNIRDKHNRDVACYAKESYSRRAFGELFLRYGVKIK